MKGDSIMSKCKVYKAFNDYFMDCRDKEAAAPKEKAPKKAKSSPEESAYVPPTDFSKYGFSKYQ
jgi:hypothetical protein